VRQAQLLVAVRSRAAPDLHVRHSAARPRTAPPHRGTQVHALPASGCTTCAASPIRARARRSCERRRAPERHGHAG
jgi:hypothetical protein